MVLQSWVPFVNYKLAPFFVFDKYKPHFVFHKLVPISSLVWCRGVIRCGSLANRDTRNKSLQPRSLIALPDTSALVMLFCIRGAGC